MDENVILERDGYRVRAVYDPYPDEPYDGCGRPVLRIDLTYRGGGGVEHIDGSERPKDDDDAIENAVRYWAAKPSKTDWKLVEKYLRTYFGVTDVQFFSSQDYWYVSYDSAAWRKYVGIKDEDTQTAEYKATKMLTEWRSWVDGDVYMLVVEKQVTWRAYNPVTDEPKYAEYPDRIEWEEIDRRGGYYGWEHAEYDASEFLTEVTDN